MKPLALQSSGVEGDFAEWNSSLAGDRCDGPDFCSRDGAQELKRKIEAYWAERGQDVNVFLHNVGFHPAIRAARFDVRSDLINGMPRPKKAGAIKPPYEEAFVEDYGKDCDDIEFE